MTPVLWLDPVAACVVTNAITPAVGLGCLHLEGAPDRLGTVRVQPSGPQTMLIGATAGALVDGALYGDRSVAFDGSGGWWLGVDVGPVAPDLPIYPASILGTATVELVPVVDESQGTGRGVWIVSDAKARVRADGSSVYPRLLLATDDVTADLIAIDAALPFGSWGGLAAIFTDYRDTIDCPECGGAGYIGFHEADGLPAAHDCSTCEGREVVSGPLSWSDAPTSPCITTIDLKEIAAASTPKENTP